MAGVPIFHIHGDMDMVVPLKDTSEEVARRNAIRHCGYTHSI